MRLIFRCSILITCAIFLLVTAPFLLAKKDTQQSQEYRDKGYEAQRAGNLDMALSFYQRAVELDPFNAMAFNDIGIVLEAKNMSDKAKEAYLKAISIDPNYLSAYFNLAALYEKNGNFEKAAYYWKMRIQLGDWSDVWTWRAKEHLDQLEVNKKVDKDKVPLAGDLGFTAKPDPKREAKYHVYRGKQFIVSGDYVEALKEFNAAIVLDPQNPEIKELLEDAHRKVLLYE